MGHSLPSDPALHRFGAARVPVMSVDAIGWDIHRPTALACAMAPFPPARNNYPGVRRIIRPGDGPAHVYVVDLLEAAAPYIAGAFDIDRFDLVEASFSLVTTPPAALAAVQRAPHFDQVDPDLIAVLHYLTDCEGTAFYRHRASGIEVVTESCLDAYVGAAQRRVPPPGYVGRDDPDFECTGSVAGKAGRLVAYPASALHSGLIPHGAVLSAEPALGRLTTNIFIKARRDSTGASGSQACVRVAP